jgi:hypothetical protein
VAIRLPAGTRARDDDRTHTCSTLDAALADGQLAEAEHEQRVRTAMTARTLGELHELIDDLQGDSELAAVRPGLPAIPGARRRPWLLIIVPLVVLGVLLAVVVRGCSADANSDSSGASAGDFGPAGYLSQAGLTDVVGAIQDEFGDALVDELTIYPEYAVVFRADPAAPRTQQSIGYNEDGFGTATDSGNRDPAVAPVDLATLDLSKVAGVIAGAPASLGLSQVDTIYAIIRSTDQGPEMSVHASNDLGESGHLTAYPDGRFRTVYPFNPGG